LLVFAVSGHLFDGAQLRQLLRLECMALVAVFLQVHKPHTHTVVMYS
jgi:hypothetical protein